MKIWVKSAAEGSQQAFKVEVYEHCDVDDLKKAIKTEMNFNYGIDLLKIRADVDAIDLKEDARVADLGIGTAASTPFFFVEPDHKNQGKLVSNALF